MIFPDTCNNGAMNGSAISVADASQVPLTLLWVIVNFRGCIKCSFSVRGW